MCNWVIGLVMSGIAAPLTIIGKLNGYLRQTDDQKVICMRSQWDDTHNSLNRWKGEWSRQDNNHWTRKMMGHFDGFQ